MSWIDVHTHINMLDLSPEEAVRNAQEAGVERMLTIGTQPSDHPLVLDLARRFYPTVHCTLGVHPHDANVYTPEGEDFMRQHFGDKEVVAVGEIGLDYYYDNSDRKTQKEIFEKQLALSIEYNLPVEIHTRDAEADTADILNSFGGKVRGLLHCFTGTQWLADRALDLGLNISISGVVTFKNAEDLRSIVKSVPLDRLHVETDAPFLSPVPMRGKKNIPSYVVHTAKCVAELKNVSMEKLSQYTNTNARKMFPKLSW
jgi:TatD DNase family protein